MDMVSASFVTGGLTDSPELTTRGLNAIRTPTGKRVVGRKYYRISSQSNLFFRYVTIRLQLLPEV
jgi:hypothetical protein